MYICVGLVLVFRHIFKPRNVKCNIFSELTLNASLLFFRKKINEKCSRKILRDKWNLNRTLSKNFVLKIHCGKPNFARQIKFAWQWKSENQTLWINVVLSFKFRKYKTAFNNGLKIWLLPDFPAENPLLNGMFCYFCNGLVLHLRHIFKPQNVRQQLTHNLLKRSVNFAIDERILILHENTQVSKWNYNR